MNVVSNRNPASWPMVCALMVLAVVATPLLSGAAGRLPVPTTKTRVPGANAAPAAGGSMGRESPVALHVSHALPAPSQAEKGQAAAFAAENAAAMRSMMAAMDIEPSGDVDRDFVESMVPHHQGAIDMATALLRHGSNPRLRRLAQEIIVTQQEEITAMRLAIGDRLPPSTPAPTQQFPAAAQKSLDP